MTTDVRSSIGGTALSGGPYAKVTCDFSVPIDLTITDIEYMLYATGTYELRLDGVLVSTKVVSTAAGTTQSVLDSPIVVTAGNHTLELLNQSGGVRYYYRNNADSWNDAWFHIGRWQETTGNTVPPIQVTADLPVSPALTHGWVPRTGTSSTAYAAATFPMTSAVDALLYGLTFGVNQITAFEVRVDGVVVGTSGALVGGGAFSDSTGIGEGAFVPFDPPLEFEAGVPRSVQFRRVDGGTVTGVPHKSATSASDAVWTFGQWAEAGTAASPLPIASYALAGEPPPASTSWLWLGAPASDGVGAVAKLNGDATSCRLAVSDRSNMASPVYGDAAAPTADRYVRLSISGLTSRKRYWCQVEIDGELDTATTGTFRTIPAPLEQASFVIDSGSCNYEGSTHRVWDNIRVHNPDVFAQLGDLHYRDISTANESLFLAAYDGNMASERMKVLSRSVPWIYVWDDHDFGPDNSHAGSGTRDVANTAYRKAVPHLPLEEATTGIYHAFGFGRVWFIATDLRSFRSPNSATDDASKTMLGATQKQWFKDQLVAARDAGYRMIVWLNTQVWVAETGVQTDLGSDTDHWGAFSTERAELAQFMADENVPQVVILSGDMHSCAYKLNADPAGVGGSGRIHVFQGAALDQSSNYRGVGWDQGPNGGGGRYGRLRVTDAPSGIMTVRWEAVQVDNTTGAHTVVFDTEFTISDSIKSQLLNGDSSLATVRSRWGSVQEYVKRPIESP